MACLISIIGFCSSGTNPIKQEAGRLDYLSDISADMLKLNEVNFEGI